MSEALSKQEAQHVAELAKLKFNDQELDEIVAQLGDILNMVNMLNEVNTDDVQPTYSVTNNQNVLREDKGNNWQQKDALLKNAPESKDDLIRVPAILKGDDNE